MPRPLKVGFSLPLGEWAAEGFGANLLGNPLPFGAPNTQIGRNTQKYGLYHALHTLDGYFRRSYYQKK